MMRLFSKPNKKSKAEKSELIAEIKTLKQCIVDLFDAIAENFKMISDKAGYETSIRDLIYLYSACNQQENQIRVLKKDENEFDNYHLIYNVCLKIYKTIELYHKIIILHEEHREFKRHFIQIDICIPKQFEGENWINWLNSKEVHWNLFVDCNRINYIHHFLEYAVGRMRDRLTHISIDRNAFENFLIIPGLGYDHRDEVFKNALETYDTAIDLFLEVKRGIQNQDFPSEESENRLLCKR